MDELSQKDYSHYDAKAPEAYTAMLDKAMQIGLSNLPNMKEKQNANIGTLFLDAFKDMRKDQICKILKMGKYIPQEILNEHDW